jgi:magnesium transporter
MKRQPILRLRRRDLPQAQLGLPPGTVHAGLAEGQGPPVVDAIAYGPEDLDERRIDSPEELDQLRDTCDVLWVNVTGLGDSEAIVAYGRYFGMHPLAMEDVANVPQRPKAEQYGKQAFLIVRLLTYDDQVRSEQVSLYVGEGFVLTFQQYEGDCFDGVRDRIRRSAGRIRRCGADYLAYCLLDSVVDAYFPVLEATGEYLEQLERRVIRRPDRRTVASIHHAKRELITLRRVLWPQREVGHALLREAVGPFTDDTRVYLRDTSDHVTQLLELLETYRELAGGLLDAYMSALSNRTNEVMKVLAIIATVFMPLNFIAALYGMNFSGSRYNMPELTWPYAYPVVLGVMGLIALTMGTIFWRRGWLTREDTAPLAGEGKPPRQEDRRS